MTSKLEDIHVHKGVPSDAALIAADPEATSASITASGIDPSSLCSKPSELKTMPLGVDLDTTLWEDSAYGITSSTKLLDEKITRIVEEKIKETPYSDSLYAHLERAKKEGLRKGIEADTVIIDRGVAISEGVGHAKMVLGLKVKYSKEGSLPMGASFAMLKTESDAGVETEAPGGREGLEERSPKRERASKILKVLKGAEGAEGTEGTEGTEGADSAEGLVERGYLKRLDPRNMFIYYTREGGASGLVNVDHVVEAHDEYVICHEKREWDALVLTMDSPDYSLGSEIRIKNPEEAKAAWKALVLASRYKA